MPVKKCVQLLCLLVVINKDWKTHTCQPLVCRTMSLIVTINVAHIVTHFVFALAGQYCITVLLVENLDTMRLIQSQIFTTS